MRRPWQARRLQAEIRAIRKSVAKLPALDGRSANDILAYDEHGRECGAKGRWTYNSLVNTGALPGADLVEQGLQDLKHGRETDAALLVSIGAPRLAQLGIGLPTPLPDAEHRLYARLSARDPDGAHSRYNALVRRLVSFERALACAR